MERNPNDTFNTQTGGAEQGGAGGAGPSDGSFATGGGQTGGTNQGIGGTGGGGGTMGANPSGIGNTGDVAGSAGYGAGGYGSSMGTAGTAGTTGTTGTPGTPADTNLRDRAGDMASGAREKIGDATSQAREKLGDAGEKARDWKHRAERGLADTLVRGAERLRQRGSEGTAAGTQAFAGATTAGTTGAVDEGRIDQLSGNVARGMEATAEWLREGDLRESIETQARTHPGRTLLIALGLGYLLGKSIRR